MKNREKFKTDREAREAHDEWCINKTRMCSQECDHCFNNWLDLNTDDTEGNDLCYADDVGWLWKENEG